ncbi:MAG TPA: hypothetical protein VGE46_10365 [Bdellovibrio sp.]
MKTSFFNNSVLTVLALAALLTSACAKKDDSSVRTADRTAIATATQSANTTNHCAEKSANWGKIFDPANNSAQFEGQVKGFVSATLDPENLGTIGATIDGKTGVDFCGWFQFDSAGNLVPASSAVIIKIVDSYAGQVINGQTVQPYNVTFSAGTSGTVNHTTRQIDVVFKDNYGEIRFQGQYGANGDMNLVEGSVYYTNTVAVSGYAVSSGKLGTFRAYKSSLIK